MAALAQHWRVMPLNHKDGKQALLAALKFAAEKHRAQRRKDSEATPYINHPIAVAELLIRIGSVTDLTTLLAAILHDTLEDTQTTIQEIEQQFGKEVCRIVQEVTDDKTLPKPKRKQMQIAHAPHLSKSAKQIKIADKICNISDLTPAQPVDWSLNRKRTYLHWANKVVAGCRGSNLRLEKHFDAVRKAKLDLLKNSANPD
jgi:guanosine-3',5'-bis(diphosphate) 3'-pyrophosphohydrolase